MKKKINIIPVILAGGEGTRLWPVSRKSYPKQFTSLISKESLFQKTVKRVQSSKILTFDKPIIITNSEFRFIVEEQLSEINQSQRTIIVEPEPKNTAPAILAATLYIKKKEQDSIILILPADHIILNIDAFHRAIHKGLFETRNGNIITFGIKPTKPQTGYGYLELDGYLDFQLAKLKNFIEKPDYFKAREIYKSGNYLWNAGIFMFSRKNLIETFERLSPNSIPPVIDSIANGEYDLNFFRLDPLSWKKNKNISIDFAIMEKAKNLLVIPFLEYWSDLGDWDAVWEEQKKDKDQNAISNNSIAIDCKNTLLRSESKTQQLVGLGLENIIAISTPDAVLVTTKNRSQDVKVIVNKLKSENIPQAETSLKDHRPWGWFEILNNSDGFKVKKIMVKPKCSLSLQSHKYRSEHWVVVEGTGKVTINEEVTLIVKSESVYIPLGAKHRLENPETSPLIIIEVQTGSYLGEDDIVRYSDIYSRK